MRISDIMSEVHTENPWLSLFHALLIVCTWFLRAMYQGKSSEKDRSRDLLYNSEHIKGNPFTKVTTAYLLEKVGGTRANHT